MEKFEYVYKLTLAYDGRNYCGWQLQKNAISIHEMMMKAGKSFIDIPFTITGGSRTDSGVHALGFVASLCTNCHYEARRLIGAFNAYLPEDIRVVDSKELSNDFHPRYSSKGKWYRYTIYNHNIAIPQYIHYAHHFRKKLDIDKMKEAARFLEGEHDFIAFSSAKISVEDTVRNVYECRITCENNMIYIDVKGNGFLYNMVRKIAGILIDVGCNRKQPLDVKRILEGKDRTKTKATAPANGLTLMEVFYSEGDK